MASTLDVTKFFDREAHSDVTIKFGDREVKCHKVVLCSASEYFEMMLGVNSAFKERDQRVIELKDDDDLDAVEAMLAYIYTFDYVERFKDRKEEAGFHLSVLVTAKKYLLPKLEEKAIQAFKATKLRLDLDADAAWVFIEQHAKYSGQDEYIDGVVAALKRRHLAELIAKPEAHTMLAKERDLLRFVRNKLRLTERVDGAKKADLLFCRNCGTTFSCAPSPFVVCRVCNIFLIAQGQPTPSVSITTYWMKEA